MRSSRVSKYLNNGKFKFVKFHYYCFRVVKLSVLAGTWEGGGHVTQSTVVWLTEGRCSVEMILSL